MNIAVNKIQGVIKAASSKERVTGYTHDFYNYPARFSPVLAREIIKTFSEQLDLVLDPFMGGGTTLVEAKLLNRHAIGFDISSLSSFLTKVKVNPMHITRFGTFNDRVRTMVSELSCHKEIQRPADWISKGYQRNLSNKQTWPIRKLTEQMLFEIERTNGHDHEKDFLRCVVLKTCQWALDSKKVIPSASSFKTKLNENYDRMLEGAREFWSTSPATKAIIINKPANEIHKHKMDFERAPSLVLTSPPYPGIHVVYHRWQIFGKRETPAPFWIANSLDGHGLTHYTMGDRKQKMLSSYFKNIEDSFRSVAAVCDNKTLVVQVLAFSNIEWQLPKYLDTMESAGFEEVNSKAAKIWRDVPNRKWYAQQKGRTSSSQEVILFHKLAR